MTTIKAGDEVRVFAARPDDDGKPGIVTRVGRKWATATYEAVLHDWRGNEDRRQREIEFCIADGFERGDQFGNGYRVRTLAQVALDEREAAAVKVLRDAGISLDARRHFSLDQIEALAEVARTFTDPQTED